jgi:hypothetical protein
VARNRERLRERCDLQVHVARETVQREGRHRPRALEGPRGVDAEELEVPADVGVALVGGRLAARVERPDDYRLADLEPGDAWSELGHRAGHLVPDDLWRLHTVIHRPVGDVQVGAADATVGDVEAHLPVRRRARFTSRSAKRPPPS